MLLPRTPTTTRAIHPMAVEVIMSLPTWKSPMVVTHTTALTRAPTRAPIPALTREAGWEWAAGELGFW